MPTFDVQFTVNEVDVTPAADAGLLSASLVTVDPTGLAHVTATNLQDALAELDAAIP